jgi:hypothetical protein
MKLSYCAKSEKTTDKAELNAHLWEETLMMYDRSGEGTGANFGRSLFCSPALYTVKEDPSLSVFGYKMHSEEKKRSAWQNRKQPLSSLIIWLHFLLFPNQESSGCFLQVQPVLSAPFELTLLKDPLLNSAPQSGCTWTKVFLAWKLFLASGFEVLPTVFLNSIGTECNS